MRILLLILFSCLFSCFCFAAPTEIQFCTDDSNQFPLIMPEHENSKTVTGVQIDTINEALKELKKQKLEIVAQYHFVPWTRCLEGIKNGTFDAVISASFQQSRAAFMKYPNDAISDKNCSSQFKLMCSSYVIVTNKETRYIYKSNPKTIPQPLRAPRGYSVVKDLQDKKIDVEEFKGEEQCLGRLFKDKNGSVVGTHIIIDTINNNTQYKNAFVIDKTPYIKKSYFIPFSKKTKIPSKIIQSFWSEIGKVSDHSSKINFYYSKYK